MDIFKVPQGEFQLTRYPPRKKELLRAWDAADEYLLNYYHKEINQQTKLKILIVNDGFGALTTALSFHDITVWTDSWLAQESIRKNFIHNNLTVDNLQIKNSIETPSGDYDVVLIKTPKSLALLEDQIIRIKALVSNKTKFIAAGMVKSIHSSTLKLFEKYIGETKTSLAKKKSRLIFIQNDDAIPLQETPYPKTYNIEGITYEIINHANVFSRERLDIGTRFFLQHIPQSEKYKTIIDLGCGNGIVGIIAAEKNPIANIIFTDESFMAVESAKENFNNAFGGDREAEFIVNDCLEDVAENSVGLVLNNPPFHQQNAIGDATAWQMFEQSRHVLNHKGELWVIGNRHLDYHIKLKKLFGNCETIASNNKFVILKAIKRSVKI